MSDYATWTGAQKEAGVGDNSMAILESYVDELASTEAEIGRLSAELKEANEKRRTLVERTIPQYMDDMEVDEIKTKSGLKVTVKDSIQAGPKKDDRAQAYKWLEDNGHGGLVKRNAVFAFKKGEEAEAERMIREAGRPGKFDKSVHPSTLKSWVKEQLEEGTEIPMDLFGVFVRRVATVKTA